MTSRLLFAVRTVSRERFALIKADCDNGISPYNRAELADIQAFIGGHDALCRLREKDRELADFLQHLDSKLTVLLRKIDPTPSLLDTLELQDVNISGGGLAFWSPRPHDVGAVLEHYIVIPPMKTFICCFGEVTSCREETDGSGAKVYRVSEKFVLIMEDDREALIHYNFEQQGRVLQRRRLDGGTPHPAPRGE